jgi:hypothetical protein
MTRGVVPKRIFQRFAGGTSPRAALRAALPCYVEKVKVSLVQLNNTAASTRIATNVLSVAIRVPAEVSLLFPNGALA